MSNSYELASSVLHHVPVAQLPADLVHSLNQTYYLHVLATDPKKVLPPGKSLLAVMTHALMDRTPRTTPASQLEDRVKQVVHEAFWKEATESLSSSQPSVQLLRLRLLYNDLSDALNSLLPSEHRVLQTLKAPIPPTSSPLISAIYFLKELLHALRQRCAPSRDAAIDNLLSALDEALSVPIPSNSSTSHSNTIHTHPLAQLVVDTVKLILRLAEDMKSDINAFVFGSLSEDQLMGVIVQEAKLRERELVVQLWDDNDKSGKHAIRDAWRTWIAELRPSNNHPEMTYHSKWILRLLQALRSDKAVSCDPPRWVSTTTQSPALPQPLNQLPPQFFFSCPDLLYIQNHLQAIVITATLRSLIRISPGFVKSPGSDFMQRIWTLLKAEVDAPEHEDYIGETKLVHLADEVIHARRSFSIPDSLGLDDEKQLREAVDRTLRSTDPVFLLLQGRLTAALDMYLTSSFCDISEHSLIPEKMQTGRNYTDKRPEKRCRLVINEEKSPVPTSRVDTSALPAIKGFEDPVLVSAIGDIFQKISLSVAWVERVWGDLV
ncbi:hypothetical protein BDQ17DRAFT_1387137 [Cyathus striatus]|nr:hypothetical protein BDQ17DRAFT_1387137 [Cyathus striatus]